MELDFLKMLSPLLVAFTQTGYLIAGTVMAVLGGAIIADFLVWKMKAEEVEGTIIGVRQSGKTYRPVYRYSLDGETYEATSDSGSSSLSNTETGRVVNILVRRRDLSRARAAKGLLWPIVGALLFAPGAWLIHTAFTAYDVNGYTWATLAVMGIMSLNRLRGSILPKGQRQSIKLWREQRRQELEGMPVEPSEHILNSPAMAAQTRAAQKQAKVAAPLLVLLGAAAVAGALYLGSGTLTLLNNGIKADGQVTQLAYQQNSNGSNGLYHAIVRFRDGKGVEQTFKDGFGANPALYDEGEAVTVMYLVDDPQASAAIDRGVFNWLVPGGLGLIGILMLLGGLSQITRRDEAV